LTIFHEELPTEPQELDFVDEIVGEQKADYSNKADMGNFNYAPTNPWIGETFRFEVVDTSEQYMIPDASYTTDEMASECISICNILLKKFTLTPDFAPDRYHGPKGHGGDNYVNDCQID
jgi:hypothetical protein